MRILVITSCTGLKKHKPPNQLKYEDFTSSERLCKRTAELKDFKAPAAEMYTGQQHRHLMEGLKQLREIYGQTAVDLNIISAGYGLIRENKVIVPYDVTFQKLKKKEILERSKSLKLNKKVKTLITDYDLVFFLLGKKYVKALQLIQFPFRVSEAVTQIFIICKRTKGYSHLIPKNLPNCYVVELKFDDGFRDIRRAKGSVFKKLCEEACRQGFEVFEKVKEDPQRILEIVR